MLGAERCGRAAGDFRFAEFEVGKRDGEGVNSALRAAGQRGDRRRIEAAAQEYADGHVGDQMARDGIFEQRPHLRCRRLRMHSSSAAARRGRRRLQ